MPLLSLANLRMVIGLRSQVCDAVVISFEGLWVNNSASALVYLRSRFRLLLRSISKSVSFRVNKAIVEAESGRWLWSGFLSVRSMKGTLTSIWCIRPPLALQS